MQSVLNIPLHPENLPFSMNMYHTSATPPKKFIFPFSFDTLHNFTSLVFSQTRVIYELCLFARLSYSLDYNASGKSTKIYVRGFLYSEKLFHRMHHQRNGEPRTEGERELVNTTILSDYPKEKVFPIHFPSFAFTSSILYIIIPSCFCYHSTCLCSLIVYYYSLCVHT